MSLNIKTLTFIFDNKTDHLLLHQIAGDGPLKRKLTGIKGNVAEMENPSLAAIKTVKETCNLELHAVLLRGVVKAINIEDKEATIYFIYESSDFSGNIESKIPGIIKWVDILNIFNLQLESIVAAIMPNLLDGESFFEGFFTYEKLESLINSDIKICNPM